MALGLILPSDAGRTFTPHAPPVRVDLRPAELFEPTNGAASVPLAHLEERLFELPPPGEWPLHLIGSSDDLQAARDLLLPKGWTPSETVVDDVQAVSIRDGDNATPAASPYRPNSFLSAALSEVELEGADEPGVAIDLGCGSGRDAVFMSEELSTRTNWDVIGLDNHAAALERARALARRVALQQQSSLVQRVPRSPPRLSFEAVDLRKGGLEATLEARPSQPLRLVHGCRWLDLKLLASLPTLLAPGGLLMWSTFLDPPSGEPLAPPYRRSRRLSSGQMRQILGEASGMEVLYDGEGELLTRSTWCTAQFYCARRVE